LAILPVFLLLISLTTVNNYDNIISIKINKNLLKIKRPERTEMFMSLVPVVLEQTNRGERSWDIFSRLLKDRIIFISGEIRNEMADLIVAQLLYLNSEDSKEDIKIYINSPGGSVTAGMAIIDAMDFVDADVQTVCMGMCASMGAMILSQGTKGKRYILPNAEVLIHQPLGGTQGQATDIEIYAKNIVKTKKRLLDMIVESTGQSEEKVKADMERDYIMTSEEAVEYGIVDEIIKKSK